MSVSENSELAMGGDLGEDWGTVPQTN